MKIIPVQQYHTYTPGKLYSNSIKPDNIPVKDQHTHELGFYTPVYFGASAVDVDAEKKRLKNMIDELVAPFEPKVIENQSKLIFQQKELKYQKAIFQIQNDKNLSKDEINKKVDEYIHKIGVEITNDAVKIIEKQRGDLIDHNLLPSMLYQLKAAIDSGNYNLREVYKNYYQTLNSIETVEDLQKDNPFMSIPSDPRDVIAQRLVSTLDENFFKELARLLEQEDDEPADKYAEEKVDSLYPLCEKYMNKETYENELGNAIIKCMARTTSDYKDNLIKIRPANPKNVYITNEELNLLRFDYDWYIMTVLRAVLAKGEDINDIELADGDDFQMFPAQVKGSDYKFKQIIPNKIEKILAISDKIKRGERDYDRFGEKQLRSRLEFYENSTIAQNEDILEALMKFEYSKLLPEDLEILRDVLRGLDAIKDGDINSETFLKVVKEHDLKPKGQERLDKLEREQLEKQIREKQKYEEELNNLRETHSETVLLLHENKLPKAANIFASYYPQNLENPYMTEMLELINQFIDSDGDITFPEYLNKSIIYLDKYNCAKLQNNPILPEVSEYYKNDKIKIGQYLSNFEIARNYNEKGKNKYFDKNIANIVIEKINNGIEEPVTDFDKQKMVAQYLTRYEQYNEMSDSDKKILNKFIEKFDEDDEIDRAIMKYLVSEKYINEDTEIIFKNNDIEIPVIFSAQSKHDIFERYMYPKCIDYLIAFEHAMTKVSNDTGSSGIKVIYTNNEKATRGFEVKIAMDKDRLYSSVENPYYFDEYDFYGLHT